MEYPRKVPHANPISRRGIRSIHQKSNRSGINGKALNAERPVASMTDVIAMARETPRSGMNHLRDKDVAFGSAINQTIRRIVCKVRSKSPFCLNSSLETGDLNLKRNFRSR